MIVAELDRPTDVLNRGAGVGQGGFSKQAGERFGGETDIIGRLGAQSLDERPRNRAVTFPKGRRVRVLG